MMRFVPDALVVRVGPAPVSDAVEGHTVCGCVECASAAVVE